MVETQIHIEDKHQEKKIEIKMQTLLSDCSISFFFLFLQFAGDSILM